MTQGSWYHDRRAVNSGSLRGRSLLAQYWGMPTPSSPLIAVLWDFDGTLADTRRRNFNVIRRLLAEAVGTSTAGFPCLRSPEEYDRVNRVYGNWRELYHHEFGLTDEETDRVGRLWTAYQLRDETPAHVFEGIATVLAALHFLPHGIVSMNGRDQIARSLREANLQDEFQWIVGWEEVHIRRQKPEPDGLLACLARVSDADEGVVMYVGDHETDVRCAVNASKALSARGTGIRIVPVAAHFTGVPAEVWGHPPDYAAGHPHDVIDIARRILDNGA